MITNIYFVRHAHSTYTPDELSRPLSKEGIEAAEKVTRLLSEEKIAHVISSPYKRAIQTVEGTAKIHGLEILIEENFKERKLSEKSVDNFQDTVMKAWEDFNYALPDGESGYCAQGRGVQALENIIEKYSGGSIVIGTHGNILTLIMNYYDKSFNYDFWRNLDMPDIYKLSFGEGNLINVKRIWNNGNKIGIDS